MPCSHSRQAELARWVAAALLVAAMTVAVRAQAPEPAKQPSSGFVGLGLALENQPTREGYPVIRQVIPAAGPDVKLLLRKGDVITQVNSKSLRGLGVDQAVKLIRGPEGSTVHLGIRHSGIKRPVVVYVRRSLIRAEPR